MTQQEVIDMMRSSKSEKEWNDNCDKVKMLCREGKISPLSGDYPAYWFKEIILSGLAREVIAKF